MRIKADRGFSLIEVMLVLIILAGASFMLLLKWPAYQEKQQLDTAATRLLSDLREVRQLALGERVWYRVDFSPYDGIYRIYQGPGKSGKVVKIKEVHLPAGVEFANSDQGWDGLYFYPAGTPDKGRTYILANTRGEVRKVIVAPVECRIREE